MGDQLTLAAALAAMPAVALPAGYVVRPCRREDAAALAALYFAAYGPGVACETAEEAYDDIIASFDGTYGALSLEASPVACYGTKLVAAVMTVYRAPWDDVPDAPFIIELFTDRAYRRRGLARALVARAAAVCRDAGEGRVALRVDSDNAAACRLYESLGFRRWAPG